MRGPWDEMEHLVSYAVMLLVICWVMGWLTGISGEP